VTDPARPTLRQRVLTGETTYGFFVDLDSPLAAELCGRAGYDWLIVDLEHGAATEADLLGLLHAVEASGSTALVRPQSGERLRIGRALDLGAAGIMIPQMRSADEARKAVSFLRYPPDGVRGVALRTRGGGYGAVSHDRVRELNERVLGIVQVEAPGTVGDAADIAAIDGVDVLFVGPADLSHSLRIPGQFRHDRYRAALRAVIDACATHGKAAGILVYDPSLVPALLDDGFRFIGIGGAGALLADNAAAALAVARGA
jgi:2-keto-3-deoxy-L-rhamnonate aldolase RhmA